MWDHDDDRPAPAGAPAWIVTFADLMSLLLCFFVLLLSFSTMDVVRFKAIAAALQASLGLPGSTVVALDSAAPAIAQPEPDIPAAEREEGEPADTPPKPVDAADAESIDLATAEQQLAAREQAETEQLAQDLALALHDEIAANRIELLAEGRTVILRIRESGSFPSGAAELQQPVRAVLARIRDRLANTVGRIEVAGHTDNQPIETDRFRSNWELSSARAVSVAHELMRDKQIPPERIVVSGHADTMPVSSNDHEQGRAKNRRVEIAIRR